MFKMEVKPLPKTVALLCLWLALYRKKVLKSEVTGKKLSSLHLRSEYVFSARFCFFPALKNTLIGLFNCRDVSN